jgi:hypothetical protein
VNFWSPKTFWNKSKKIWLFSKKKIFRGLKGVKNVSKEPRVVPFLKNGIVVRSQFLLQSFLRNSSIIIRQNVFDEICGKYADPYHDAGEYANRSGLQMPLKSPEMTIQILRGSIVEMNILSSSSSSVMIVSDYSNLDDVTTMVEQVRLAFLHSLNRLNDVN